MSLPTIADAREFLAIINRGREAIGLDPVAKLDFDACTPGSIGNCLSARHLFAPANMAVTARSFQPLAEADPDQVETLMEAVGATEFNYSSYHRIPEAILVVTDPFDDKVPGLRERLAEAGVV